MEIRFFRVRICQSTVILSVRFLPFLSSSLALKVHGGANRSELHQTMESQHSGCQHASPTKL